MLHSNITKNGRLEKPFFIYFRYFRYIILLFRQYFTILIYTTLIYTTLISNPIQIKKSLKRDISNKKRIHLSFPKEFFYFLFTAWPGQYLAGPFFVFVPKKIVEKTILLYLKQKMLDLLLKQQSEGGLFAYLWYRIKCYRIKVSFLLILFY